MEGTDRPTPRPASRRPSAAIPQVEPPSCPDHGVCKYVDAGVSKATKRAYDAFYSCNDRDCTRGSKGKGYYVNAEDWLNNQKQLAAKRDPVPADVLNDVPNE